MTGVRSAPGSVPADSDQLAQRALGWEIMRLRSAAGLTRAELAGRAGLSPAVIRRYEDGAAFVVNLHQLRAIAAALGVTAGTLIDAHPAGVLPGVTPSPGPGGPAEQTGRTGPAGQTRRAGRSAFVLLPASLPSALRSATGWRLVEYVPRDIAQRWERPEAAEPGRTVSRSVLDWASDLLLHERAGLLGSAIELTGQRSWYVGPLAATTTASGRP